MYAQIVYTKMKQAGQMNFTTQSDVFTSHFIILFTNKSLK